MWKDNKRPHKNGIFPFNTYTITDGNTFLARSCSANDPNASRVVLVGMRWIVTTGDLEILYAQETSDSDKIFAKINVFVFPINGVVLLATQARALSLARFRHMVSLLLIAILGALYVFLVFRLTHGNSQNWSKHYSCKNGLKLQQNWIILGLPAFHSTHQAPQAATLFRFFVLILNFSFIS